MTFLLQTSDSDFDARFAELLGVKREISEDVEAQVRDIVSQVRSRGDAALIELTARFDRMALTAATLAIDAGERRRQVAEAEPKALEALHFAAGRIRAHHQRQKPADDLYTDKQGVTLGSRWSAIEAVGLYVPGGLANYPSSVLMNALPAKIAGVDRLVMVVPTPGGEINPLVLAAADLAGVDEIYRIGGAQAIAALAYGTQTIAPVAKIVGPGNAYVAAAKRQVFGTVGIDMIAGPSEVLIVADDSANPEWVAADLLAQAEHDSAAQAILITSSAELGQAVRAAVDGQLASLPRAEVAGASWRDFGAVILVGDISEAPALVNAIAPEHLELAIDDPQSLLPAIRNAGAIFAGHHTPEAVGDYVAGSNHVLPTARSARHSSGLSVLDFMKRSSFLQCDAGALSHLGPAAVALARAEGLDAHARSVTIRTNSED